MGKISKSIKELKDNMAFINSPKSYFADYKNLKDLLNGKRITVEDLVKEEPKNLIIAMYISQVKMNSKVRFHDFFIKGFIGTVVLGAVAAIVLYSIRGIL